MAKISPTILSLEFFCTGCESSEIQSVVTLLLVDVKTEEEYVLAKGTNVP